MTQPNRERIQLWVEALKSGEFQQTQGTLRDDLRAPGTKRSVGEPKRSVGEPEWGYCCLGVAIEVALRNGVKSQLNWANGGSDYSVLWPEVVDWYGLPNGGDPHIGPDPVFVSLTATRANDEKWWTFHQIAEGIQTVYLPDEEVAQ